MFENIGQKWMAHKARQALKKIQHAMSFPLHATSIQRVLVIMPRDLNLMEAAHQFINRLRETFPFWDVQMFDVDKMPKEKLNWMGVPSKEYIQELKNRQYDMIIDLNRQTDWLITYLTVMSGAPYRVHVENEDGSFFNIQVKTGTQSPYSGLIEAFTRLFVLQ